MLKIRVADCNCKVVIITYNTIANPMLILEDLDRPSISNVVSRNPNHLLEPWEIALEYSGEYHTEVINKLQVAGVIAELKRYERFGNIPEFGIFHLLKHGEG